jgi:hypothetical protein
MRTSIGILLLAIALTVPASGQDRQSLTTGQSLETGGFLVSANQRYFAVMQTDGNFCVYRGSGPADNRGSLWCSMKTAEGGQFRAVMQSDGNFVVYPVGSSSALWASMSAAEGGQFIATMQDDGNFVIYPGTAPSGSTAMRAIWNSGTAAPHRHPFDIPFPSPQPPYTWPNERGELIECGASPFDRIDLGEVGPMHIYAGDGCSMPSSDPVSEAYKQVFSQACRLHDICYLGPGNTKAYCDGMFEWHMNRDCDHAYSSELGRGQCHLAAKAWRAGLETPLSSEYFNRSQDWGSRNCKVNAR